MAKKGGTPIFGHFLEILGISGENGVQSWPPREFKSAEKTGHQPSGVISEVLPRVDFALPVGKNRLSSHLLVMGGPIWGGELPETLAKKGVPLFWALFGDFGDFR